MEAASVTPWSFPPGNEPEDTTRATCRSNSWPTRGVAAPPARPFDRGARRRPGLYTVMDYGAVDFESAKQDPSLLEGLARHLYYDIYLVQQIDLGNNQPLPPFQIWPDRPVQPLLEFQNDANATVRISRVVH